MESFHELCEIILIKMFSRKSSLIKVIILWCVSFYISSTIARDEDKIIKACYWPNEVYDPCFGGCAEVSCDNPRNHLRPCYPYCEPGCICEDPYVRDDRTHQCVLPQDCTPTQMGIPVPSKHVIPLKAPPPSKQSPSLPPQYSSQRKHRQDFPAEYQEPDLNGGTQRQDDKKKQDLTRMGNYFNIVIAPPPIKALQPRKILQNN